eukprot:scaffold634791_cov59-Attheya_sp.AAC.2
MSQAHGLAGSIRSASAPSAALTKYASFPYHHGLLYAFIHPNIKESETFDLAGQNQTTISHTIMDAFKEPFPLSEMIRITFITGAGKLGRQKYDDGAAKAVTATLRELGFEEDRGASCVAECAGTFKMQHDTGKNLKTVVVFPNIVGDTGNDTGLEGGMDGLSTGEAPLIPKSSPVHMIVVSSSSVFSRMLSSKCPSWSQKRGCLTALGQVKDVIEQLDAKLLTGTPLSNPEQDLYDSVSIASIGEKEAFIKKEMQAQVEGGEITNTEKVFLVNQVTEKIESMTKEVAEAQAEKKPKKADKLNAIKEKTLARQKMLEGITPVKPHPLRHEAEIAKLRKEMRPLQQLEDSAKGRLLSVKETTTLARKDEILEDIEQLEIASRGWFEDGDSFDARVVASRTAASKVKVKKVVKKTPGAGDGFTRKPVT